MSETDQLYSSSPSGEATGASHFIDCEIYMKPARATLQSNELQVSYTASPQMELFLYVRKTVVV